MSRIRLFEICMGLASWNLILFPVWGGYFFPEPTAYYILLFVVYSVYRSFTLTIAVLVSNVRMKAAAKVNWINEAKGFGDWNKVKHIVLIMVANEPLEAYVDTVKGLANQTLNPKNIVPVIATEERYPDGKKNGEKLKEELGHKFGDFLIAVHPKDIPGEVRGKSSNENWAAREAKRILVDEKKWDMDYITITSNDADAILDRQYFAYLTFKFLDDPHRYERFWQPAVVFYKNIWEIPAITRVVNTLSSIMNIAALSRKDRLVSFSNYSASLKMIDAIGYWDTDVIPEDYRIFFKAFFALEGKVEVEPIYLPSSTEAPQSATVWKTFVNDYQQKKRWAWGVSDVPRFMEMFLSKPKGSLVNRVTRLARVFEHHLMWPVNWFVITLGATVATFINPAFQRTTLGSSLPSITSGLMSVTLLFLVIMLWVEYSMRPAAPNKMSKLRLWLTPFEFVMMPIAGFFFSALPGLDAHTRMLLGKYLEYRITEKIGK